MRQLISINIVVPIKIIMFGAETDPKCLIPGYRQLT